jgi:DNA-binding XRE family transcriptional regulator
LQNISTDLVEKKRKTYFIRMEKPEETFFSRNIRELRERSNLSQRALAKNLGLSAASIRNYEMGYAPPLDVAMKICEFFGVALEDVVYREIAEAGSMQKSQKELKQELFMGLCEVISVQHELIKHLKG